MIIPAYGGAAVLPAAIESVLKQTWQDFEIIVVDDCSPDNTAEVVRSMVDPRIRYLRNAENQGAFTARKTAMGRARGKLIAFLDQDDAFHPDKLACHVRFMEAHPEVGSSCNARFNVESWSGKVFGVWDPPGVVGLSDLVLGFPISPSDAVVRREWAIRDEVWDDSFALRRGDQVIFNGGETVIWGRMALAGCHIGNVGRVLNYRRYHKGRIQRDLAGRCEAELRCQRLILEDARCPGTVRQLEESAFSETYMVWVYTAYAQGDLETGRRLLARALKEIPALSKGSPPQIVELIFRKGLVSAPMDGTGPFLGIVKELPPQLRPDTRAVEEMNAHILLATFCRNALWNGMNGDCPPALPPGYEPGEVILADLVHQLRCHDLAHGDGSAEAPLRDLAPQLNKVLPGFDPRVLGRYQFNRAIAARSEKRKFKCLRIALRRCFTIDGSLVIGGFTPCCWHRSGTFQARFEEASTPEGKRRSACSQTFVSLYWVSVETWDKGFSRPWPIRSCVHVSSAAAFHLFRQDFTPWIEATFLPRRPIGSSWTG